MTAERAAIPARFGRYDVTRLLGTGGFATVWDARDEGLDANVAVKVLADSWTHDLDVRERFIAEARLLRRLSHPSLVPVHDVGETDTGQPWFVMGMAERGTLADRVTSLEGHVLTPRDVLPIVEQLTEGLAVLHGERVVHRDVTPSNLLLFRRQSADVVTTRTPVSDTPSVIAPDERLVLGDLGLAKDLARRTGLTTPGGTSLYASPEQMAGGLVDHRADIFGASALVEWLLDGKAAGADGVRSIPHALAKVLEKGMAVDPEERHGTIREWRDAVVTAITGERPVSTSGAARPATVASSAASTSTGPSPARRWAIPVAALVALAGLAVWLLAGRTSTPPEVSAEPEQNAVPTEQDDGVTETEEPAPTPAPTASTDAGAVAGASPPVATVVGQSSTLAPVDGDGPVGLLAGAALDTPAIGESVGYGDVDFTLIALSQDKPAERLRLAIRVRNRTQEEQSFDEEHFRLELADGRIVNPADVDEPFTFIPPAAIADSFVDFALADHRGATLLIGEAGREPGRLPLDATAPDDPYPVALPTGDPVSGRFDSDCATTAQVDVSGAEIRLDLGSGWTGFGAYTGSDRRVVEGRRLLRLDVSIVILEEIGFCSTFLDEELFELTVDGIVQRPLNTLGLFSTVEGAYTQFPLWYEVSARAETATLSFGTLPVDAFDFPAT